MRRKIYDKLLLWKQEKNGSTALMIEGACRVGKSYIAKEFARNEYDSFILIDFSRAPQRVKDWFEEYLEDADTLLQNIQLHYKKQLTPRKSLIIFDEVQKCPKARESVKALVENIVAQMLKTAGSKLFFYNNYDKEEAGNRMQVDFLIQKEVVTSRHNISPIEVKISTNYTLTSIKKCIKKFGQYLSTPYVLHTNDVEQKDGLVYLPLYMTPLL